MNLAKLFLFALLLLSSAPGVSASYISLSTSVGSCVIEDGSCNLDITIENVGDETAYGVGGFFSFPFGFDADSFYAGELGVNESIKKTAAVVKSEEKIPGTYPGMLFLEYNDVNGYPFSALVKINAVVGQGAGSPISGKMKEVTLRGTRSRTMRLVMKNPEERGYNTTIKLFVPQGLDVLEAEKKIEIGPGEEKIVEFEVSSLSALPGSTYPVFCAITHEGGGRFYSTYARGTIVIGEEYSIFSSGNMAVVLALLLVVLIFYQVK